MDFIDRDGNKLQLNPFDGDSYNQLVFAEPGAGMSFQASQLAKQEGGVFIIDVGPGYHGLLSLIAESMEAHHE